MAGGELDGAQLGPSFLVQSGVSSGLDEGVKLVLLLLGGGGGGGLEGMVGGADEGEDSPELDEVETETDASDGTDEDPVLGEQAVPLPLLLERVRSAIWGVMWVIKSIGRAAVVVVDARVESCPVSVDELSPD
jgi:hypothetical protein